MKSQYFLLRTACSTCLLSTYHHRRTYSNYFFPQVSARDSDAAGSLNSQIRYAINRRQSDPKRTFNINENTGLIVLAKNVHFETDQVHEIVVVARDGGEVPQETSAFVTVRVNQAGTLGYVRILAGIF